MRQLRVTGLASTRSRVASVTRLKALMRAGFVDGTPLQGLRVFSWAKQSVRALGGRFSFNERSLMVQRSAVLDVLPRR